MATMRRNGFTLVEMVLVIVLLGILGGVLGPVILRLMENYSFTRTQADLTARGRLALERIVREVRHAVPGTVQDVTSGGNPGVEFVRARTGGMYVHEADNFGAEFSQAVRRFPITPAPRSELYALVPPVFAVNAGELLVIGNTDPAGFMGGATRAALTGIAGTDALLDGTAVGRVLQFGAHTFGPAYAGNRFVIADEVVEIGRVGNTLRWRTVDIAAAGIGSYDGSGDWSAGDPLLVDGVTAVAFTYRPGTTQAAGVLQISLTLTEGAESVELYQEAQVRNTP